MSRLARLFQFIVARRGWVIATYAVLMVPGTYFALRVHHDNSIDRLIVESDPDYLTAQEFNKVFGTGEYIVLLAESDDPYAPAALGRFDELERALQRIPKSETTSILTIFRRARAGFEVAAQASELHRFATGTELFRKQGLVGDRFLSIALVLQRQSADQRRTALATIEQIAARFRAPPFTALRVVGQPVVNLLLDQQTSRAGVLYFSLFGLFVVILTLALYRSFRALAAILITLGVTSGLTVGYIGATGGVFTIVSSLVPMTILITCMATLVYIHSRFVEQPLDRTVDEHQILALAHKFPACSASVFATAVGFAALAVSKIRPIREMGIWVAVGLLITWITVFTLFPALQKILRTPTQQERRISGQWFERLTSGLPRWSYRYRWPLVVSSLLLCGAGTVALFGFPGHLEPMQLETNALEYINHESALYRDTKALGRVSPGLSLTEVWLQASRFGAVSDPQVVRGLDHFQRTLEEDLRQFEADEAQAHHSEALAPPAVVGLPTMMRVMHYIGGQGDRLPESDDELEKMTGALEALLPREPMLQRFVALPQLDETHLVVVTHTSTYRGYQRLEEHISDRWQAATQRDPVLAQFKLRTTGIAKLQAKISHHLIPTLIESFLLSVAIIYAAFLVVFRNGAARLMAMIPSLFAILVMFLVMRLVGMGLNAATILIASTTLGASENDQIHFFFHFLERRKTGTDEQSLRHALAIAGRAIFFATLINAGGFLAFALADLPPIRQFGFLSAVAFILSMLADFTALLGALWLIFRSRPDDAPRLPDRAQASQ